MKEKIFFHLVVIILLTACGNPDNHPPIATTTESTQSNTQPTDEAPSTTPSPQIVFTPTSTPLPAELSLSPDDWKSWPILPTVTERARQIYQRGQVLGNNAHAFSIFGDCQSLPEYFLGVYDTDVDKVNQLPPELQETVAFFSGSFDRNSPTIRGGTTAGSLLWMEWHQEKFGCLNTETPVACELRINRPSYVFIHVGTHWEARNINYLRKIIDQLIDNGTVPILVTKADNRELDERINYDMALLADEYDLPFWNFWAATIDLPEHGLYVRGNEENMGKVYLTEEAAEIHRFTALQALYAVWQAVTSQP